MRRILMIVVFTLAMSTLAFSQANDKQAVPSMAERELISLSHEFVDSAITKEIIVLEKSSASTSNIAPATSVRGKWQSVVLDKIKIRLDGDRALVRGRVTFKGEMTAGHPLGNNSNVTIHFSKQKGQWKFVRGCLGICD